MADTPQEILAKHGTAEDVYLVRSLRTMTVEQLLSIPIMAQTQASLTDQMMDLRAVANRLGMYDAADELQRWIERGRK